MCTRVWKNEKKKKAENAKGAEGGTALAGKRPGWRRPGVGGPLDGVGITRVWKCFAISKSGMCLLVCAKARYRKPPTGGLADSTGVRKSGLRFRRVTRIKNARRTRARTRIRTWRVLPRPFFFLSSSRKRINLPMFFSSIPFSLSHSIALSRTSFILFSPSDRFTRLRVCARSAGKKNNTD